MEKINDIVIPTGNEEGLSEQIKAIINQIVGVHKKSGSITTTQLFEALEKEQATPNELEEVVITEDELENFLK